MVCGRLWKSDKTGTGSRAMSETQRKSSAEGCLYRFRGNLKDACDQPVDNSAHLRRQANETRTGTAACPSLPQHKHVTTVLHPDSESDSENSEHQKTAMNRPGIRNALLNPDWFLQDSSTPGQTAAARVPVPISEIRRTTVLKCLYAVSRESSR